MNPGKEDGLKPDRVFILQGKKQGPASHEDGLIHKSLF